VSAPNIYRDSTSEPVSINRIQTASTSWSGHRKILVPMVWAIKRAVKNLWFFPVTSRLTPGAVHPWKTTFFKQFPPLLNYVSECIWRPTAGSNQAARAWRCGLCRVACFNVAYSDSCGSKLLPFSSVI